MELKKFYEYKAVGFVIVLVVVLVGFFLLKKSDTTVVNQIPEQEIPSEPATSETPTTTTQKITEANFTGSIPTISGSSALASAAREYIKTRVTDFRLQANTDVPDMREKFGADSPTANYTIDIGAKYINSDKTESIVIDMYAYTGGANGNSSFKVFTASRDNGKILSLSDIVKGDEKNDFTEFVKRELNAWKPAGADGPVVFAENVKTLNFDSFVNWSIDDKNLIIYFDKYEIGPGVLGAVAFPIPLDKIKDFLK